MQSIGTGTGRIHSHTKDGASVQAAGHRQGQKELFVASPKGQVAACEACQGKQGASQGWAWGCTQLGPQRGSVWGGPARSWAPKSDELATATL